MARGQPCEQSKFYRSGIRRKRRSHSVTVACLKDRIFTEQRIKTLNNDPSDFVKVIFHSRNALLLVLNIDSALSLCGRSYDLIRGATPGGRQPKARRQLNKTYLDPKKSNLSVVLQTKNMKNRDSSTDSNLSDHEKTN